MGELKDLASPSNSRVAVQCLNELVTDALQHVPDVFLYMSRLKNQSVFNFCAIPQVQTLNSSIAPSFVFVPHLPAIDQLL